MAMSTWNGVTRPTLAGLATLAVVSLSVAYAHDTAEWIQRGGYKNALGELCCGERDCAELADNDIRITNAGYFVKSINETIPFHEATPSPNGRYWRCYWGGKRKCFFAPPPAT